jgi:UDP-N-acetylmuramate dehydrogenase
LINIDDIQTFFHGRIALSEPLSNYTWFRIGGPADYYLEPTDKHDAINAISYLQQQSMPFIIIGKGSNMLVSDEGVRGAVINFEHGLTGITLEGELVIVEAGMTLARFVDFCVQRGFQGVEMLPGIPGTIGGAIIMNAGAYGGEISDHLIDVEVLRHGKVVIVKKEDAGFAYRKSGFSEDIILGARFKFPFGDKAEIMNIRRELLLKRNRAQPVNYPNSGSMFKNPPGMFAAKLIEQAGLKGTRIGNAQISERHANFIVNLGAAKAADVLALIECARKTVLEKFAVTLELEVKLIGFSQHLFKEMYS